MHAGARTKKLLQIVAGATLAAAAVAVPAERAAAGSPPPTTYIDMYITTAGSASGGGPFYVSVNIGPFGVGQFVTTGGSTTESVGPFQAAVGSGNIDYQVATNSQGFAWDNTNATPFFVSAMYCIDVTTLSGVLSVPFAFTPGDAYNCYAELAKAATVNLTKEVVNGPSTWEYEFGLDNLTDLNGDSNKFNDVDDALKYPSNGSPSVSWTEVIKPGQSYTVTEYGETNSNNPIWIDVDCDIDDGDGTFTPGPGQTINCTATNYGAIPLTVDKRATGGDGTFEYTLTHATEGDPQNFSISTTGGASGGVGEGSTTIGMDYEGAYTLTETDQDGWTEGTIECTVHHADDTTTESTGGFTVVKSDTVECFVVNQRPLDVTMTKTVTGDTTPQPGGTTQYTMVVTNHSQYWATYLALIDELPAHLVPTDTPTPGCTIQGQKLTCKLPALAPGASTTVVVNVQVAADAPVPVSLDNTAALYSVAVEALVPTALVSSAAQVPDTGAESLTLAALALGIVAAGFSLLGVSRRTIWR